MDLKALGDTVANSHHVSPMTHVGRVLQFDADFACYEASDLERPAMDNFKNLLDLLHFKRSIVGADHINCFITLGYKSGRDTMATVKPYQENRDPDAPIKVRVRELRHLLANYTAHNLTPVVCHFFEADDLMCRYQQDMINAGDAKNTVIMSGDKDLWMVQGYHACQKTGRMWLVKGYGHTEYREVGNTKPKLVGEGTSWFWHQMIMGDRVDNIPGLEKLNNTTLDRYLPLKSKKMRKAGAGSCGEAKAVAILEGVTSAEEAARRVYEAYREYYGAHAETRFMEQAYLLWMQRTDSLLDVQRYVRKCGLPVKFSQRQLDIIADFTTLKGDRI